MSTPLAIALTLTALVAATAWYRRASSRLDALIDSVLTDAGDRAPQFPPGAARGHLQPVPAPDSRPADATGRRDWHTAPTSVLLSIAGQPVGPFGDACRDRAAQFRAVGD